MSLPDFKHEATSAKPFLTVKNFHLEILDLGGVIEYRVKRVRKRKAFPFQDGVIVLAVAFLIQFLIEGHQNGWSFASGRIVLLAVVLTVLWSKSNVLHHESVLAIPTIGLQLEAHRGLSIFGKHFTTRISRTFIPISTISDIFINEGLCGWNVRRYLAILPAEESRLQVVFEALDPPFPVLKEVYHGLRETLFSEWDEGE
ncbi:hypothetical protein BDV93DRAFT_500810 [Ceratobasidium sp. AG-I]|nr:hypothetical protein BDV93DRAFT_500810 [Ceratobasidium sp. AG-I]